MPDTWLCEQIINDYFGPSHSLEQLVARGQWLQAEGLKFIYEESRRQKPRCAMAINWCFNEPWPTAANQSLISWPARPKPALAEVANACRPITLSCRVTKFLWHNGETMDLDVFLLNDKYDSLSRTDIQYKLKIGAFETIVSTWNFNGSDDQNTNIQGPSFTVLLPRIENVTELEILLECREFPEWNQRYRLRYDNNWTPPLYGPAARKALNQ